MNPQIFLVGGAVRDHLLGRESRDRDYVVVGADVQWMLDRGYQQVGQSFPVFLHPETGEEYALARREKKVAPGYTGFEFEFGPHVTLEDDLIRRDLTINSMAMNLETGEIIDPHGGQEDLKNHVLRHTSSAFAEDPLRVLRVARFAARYNFVVAEATLTLMEAIVDAGEIDHLSNERLWTEIAKICSEPLPTVAFTILHQVGALYTDALGKYVRLAPQRRARQELDLRMNTLEKMLWHLGVEYVDRDEVSSLCIPKEVWRRATFVHELLRHAGLFEHASLTPEVTVNLFDRFRNEFKNGDHLWVEDFSLKTELLRDAKFFNALRDAVTVLSNLHFDDLAKTLDPKLIGAAVKQIKVEAVKNVWKDA